MVGEENWVRMTELEQRIAAYRISLINSNPSWNLTNCEFVRYDEELYDTLVSSGAVAEEKGRMKVVTLDATELGRFQAA